jgi:hypothetical protein
MTQAGRRIRIAIAVVVVASMTASTIVQAPDAAARTVGQPAPARTSGQPAAAADAAGFDWAALVPTAASLHSVAVGVPDDPIAAAEHLVEIVWGDDSLGAVSATGEILRRAGLPLVSADGPVVALPDGNVITTAPVIVELLPTLTAAARAGTMHTPDQVAELLEVVGFAAKVPAGRDVVGLLAAWGKSYDDRSPDDIAEVRAAGAAARALARTRGQLLIPATVATPEQQRLLADDPGALPGVVSDWLTSPSAVTGIDPITTVMLLAHAAGDLATDVSMTPAPRGLRGAAAGAVHGNGGGSGCEALEDESESRADTEAKGGAKEYVKGKTRDAAEAAAERYAGKSGRKWANAGGEAYDKLTDAISVVLLLLGAKLELDADKTETHFRHRPGDRTGDVTVTATASFSSALAKKHLACWSLIGIDVPPDGKLEGYTVNWRLSKTPQAFQAFSDSRDKFAKGDVTGPDGVSTVSVYPRTELSPPGDGETQPELTLNATVYAGLDKDDFPWKFSDLVDMASSGGLGGAAVKALYALLMNLVKRGALPTMAFHIPVKYHGQMPFVMVGDMHAASSFVSIAIDFRADLYSCTGPLGPWQGTAGSGGDVQIRHTGSAPQIVGSGQGDFPMRFELAKTGQPQRFHVAEGVGIQVELDVGEVDRVLNPTVVRDMYDTMQGKPVVVGTGTWTLEGQEVARRLGGASTMSWAAGTERFDVVSRATDDRCGGSSYWADQRFDRTERG